MEKQAFVRCGILSDGDLATLLWSSQVATYGFLCFVPFPVAAFAAFLKF